MSLNYINICSNCKNFSSEKKIPITMIKNSKPYIHYFCYTSCQDHSNILYNLEQLHDLKNNKKIIKKHKNITSEDKIYNEKYNFYFCLTEEGEEYKLYKNNGDFISGFTDDSSSFQLGDGQTDVIIFDNTFYIINYGDVFSMVYITIDEQYLEDMESDSESDSEEK